MLPRSSCAISLRARVIVEATTEVDGHPVAVREGQRLAVAFHAELGSDVRLHRLFLELLERWLRTLPARS